jgi:predicted type IV restriction endonuclease
MSEAKRKIILDEVKDRFIAKFGSAFKSEVEREISALNFKTRLNPEVSSLIQDITILENKLSVF